ncbi:recombinase family protein [Neobacillus ginsengisoli]|uniref:DNA invertase Pin-like site-specific DNA recombinase n=1 Tax=Neobacillus ginsengisoli TaxID=904295 RepID=A0ABT9XPK1_9BACI|nr:recombinase family protein [Neobacillus ginsengisoli]MDQ0197467.1 DNA invertase Pin-like site-specific DNA recombinase [Neobacillus ginsengisoli]
MKIEKKVSKVAVYVRKSREEETEETMNRQQAVLIDLCEKNNWSWELFKEVGSSQDLAEREELQKMLEKVNLFYFDAVVVADLDRLSRNVIHFGQIKMLLVNAGVLVVTPSKTFDFSNESDDMFSDFMSVIAKSEYQQIKKRLVRGTRQSAKQGNWLGKKNPVGYKYNKETKKLEPSKDAPVIKKMFKLYLEGLSIKDIAFKFDHENVVTTIGLIWTPAGVSRLLNNPVYAGHSLYGKTTQRKVEGKRVTKKTKKEEQILAENTHEALISQEDWEQVQAIKEKRNFRPPSLKLGKHKFSGLIICGICGGVHSFQTSRGNKKRISSCQTRQYNGDMTQYSVCPNKGANVSEFEKLFYTELGQYADKLEEYVKLIKGADKGKIVNREGEIDTKRKQIQKLEQSVKRVQHGFIMEVFSESEAQQQIKQLKDQIQGLEEQIEQLRNQEESNHLDFVEITLNKIRKVLTGGEQLSEVEANDILRDYIEAIFYTKTGNNIEIEIVWKDIVGLVA